MPIVQHAVRMLTRRHLGWALPILAAGSVASRVSLAAGVVASATLPASLVTHYRTQKIDRISIFCREAGPPSAPVVLLLHGFPTSSHMFRNLIPALADRYHVVAPHYPGFGESAAPDPKTLAYTFAHYADIIDNFTEKLGLKNYALY